LIALVWLNLCLNLVVLSLIRKLYRRNVGRYLENRGRIEKLEHDSEAK
jgi:hypothetical protein